MQLMRSIFSVASFTLLSRITGFIREVVMARYLGAGMVTDAVVMAMKVPSLFRRIFAEGAFNAAFVPILAEALVGGEKEARQCAEEILAVLLWLVVPLVILVEITLPWTLPMILFGMRDDPERLALTIHFCQITFPFLFFISLTAFYSGVLNTLGRFALAASSPAAGNMAIVVIILMAHAGRLSVGDAVAWGIVVCGVVQCLWVWVPLQVLGFRMRWILPRLTPLSLKFLRKLGPAVLGSGVVQLNLFIEIFLASALATGGISYLHYADRLNQLPLSMFGTAVGTALLPLLSRQIQEGEKGAAQSSQNLALEFCALLSVPAALLLFFVAEPMITLAYFGGEFTLESVRATAWALMAFSWGLPAYILMKVLVTNFFARGDTTTPMVVSAASVVFNIAISLVLRHYFGYIGLAIAMPITSWVQVLTLAVLLRRQNQLHVAPVLRYFLPKVAVGSVAMMAWVQAVQVFYPFDAHAHLFWQILQMGVTLGGAVVIYGGLLWQQNAFKHWPPLSSFVRRR